MEKNLNFCTEAIKEGFEKPSVENEKFSDAVLIILNAVSEHIKNSPTIRSLLEKQDKGLGTNCPDSPVEELIKYLASQNGKIDKSNSLINLGFIKKFVLPVFSFERNCLQEAIFNNKNISKKEAQIFITSLVVSGLFDELYCHWFEKIIVAYDFLGQREQSFYYRDIEKELSDFDYTVFNYSQDVGITNRQTWAEAFPSEIGAIVSVLRGANILDGQEFNDYFWALADAYDCRDISQLENLWHQVDEKWVKISNSCRLLPIHGMEKREHDFCVSPEFRLLVRTENGEQKMVDQIKNSAPKFAFELGIKEELVEIASKKMENIEMGVFVTALKAGAGANFKLSGQTAPKRKVDGVKVFLDFQAVEDHVDRCKKILTKYCEPNQKDLFSNLLTPKGLIAQTIFRQCIHYIGCTPESDERLGEKKFILEEARKTCGGAANILENFSQEEHLELLAFSVAKICSFFDAKMHKDKSFQPYFNETLAMANFIINAGLVEVSGKNLKIKLSKEGFKKWNLFLRDFYFDVIKSYHSTNSEKIDRKKTNYCQITPEIKKWIELAKC